MKGNVAGDVRHPGMYPMQGDSDTTVVKAIALSQGLDSFNSGTAYIYRLRQGGGGRFPAPPSDGDCLAIPLHE